MTKASILVFVLAACRGDHVGEAIQELASAACMEDSWKSHGNAQELNCTANDVGIASAGNIRDTDGQPLSQCVEGTAFSFIADFTVGLTAQARFDIGLYFAVDGDLNNDGALTGACDVSVVTPADSANFVQLDALPDSCGDIDAAHNPQVVTIQVDDVVCEDSDGDGQLNLPNCTSWRQSGSNEVCDEAGDAYPGSPSKCNCDVGFNVPITVAPPEAEIVKSFVALLCVSARYGISVANTSSSGAQLVALTDSTYGDLMTVHDRVLATTCESAVIPVGGVYDCTFDAEFCGALETDAATGTIVGEGGTIVQTSNVLVVQANASGN